MYLPENYTHDTEFPLAFGKDLFFQARKTREQYRRFMPKIDYFCLLITTTPGVAAPESNTSLVGETGTTKFDPLWGEAVPIEAPGATVWQQPHGTAAPGAVLVSTDPELFAPVVTLHGRVRREARENELKRLGFDRVRDLLITFPTLLLDEAGVTCRPGDQFIWDGDRFVVMQEDSGGYWKNSNIRLFRTLNCEHVHSGS